MRGTIRERGKGRWQVQVYTGRGPDGREHRVARTIHGKKADAETALRDLIREVESGQHRGDDPTVAQLAEQWYHTRRNDWTGDTQDAYRRTLDNWIFPHLGNHKARKVTALTIDQAYTAMTAAGVGAQTVRKAHTVLRSMYTQAVRWGTVTVNPAANATPPRVVETPVAPADPAALRRLMDAIDTDPCTSAFVRMAMTTGCRRGELCALQWGDVDLETRTMTVVRAGQPLLCHAGIVTRPTSRGVRLRESGLQRCGSPSAALSIAVLVDGTPDVS